MESLRYRPLPDMLLDLGGACILAGILLQPVTKLLSQRGSGRKQRAHSPQPTAEGMVFQGWKLRAKNETDNNRKMLAFALANNTVEVMQSLSSSTVNSEP